MRMVMTILAMNNNNGNLQASPPWFVQPLVDRLERKGERVTLTCVVEGCPPPTIRWYVTEDFTVYK